jgi:hypothetical protein
MSVNQAIGALQQELARLAQVQQPGPDELPTGDAVQLARLHAAQAALKLAAILLDDTNTATAQPIWQQFNARAVELATWRRSGRGWFEERTVRRGQKRHGPYRYFRWRDAEGRTQTRYLGRVEQAASPPPAAPVSAALLPTDAIPWRGTVQPVRIGTTKKVHLMLPEPGETTTLCGRPLGSQPLHAVAFQYDDCARCRTAATKLGRICAHCGTPLVMQAGAEICTSCALRGGVP